MNDRQPEHKDRRPGDRGPKTFRDNRGASRPASGRPGGKPGFAGHKRPGPGASGRPGGKRPEDRQAQNPSPARAAALEALRDVLDRGAYVSEAVDRQLSKSTFPQVERRFCTALVYGTLENLTAIDHILDAYIEEPEKLDQTARHILRLSVCQKAFMDKVPDNAIADEAVKLTRASGLEYLTGLVNGVLRSYMREPEKVVWPDEQEEPARFLSLRWSYPEWVAERLIAYYGLDTAEKVLKSRPLRHDMTLRPNLTRLSDEQFEQMLSCKVWQAEKGRVPHSWHVSGVMQVARDSDYLSGAFSIQGEASMLCALLTGARPGMTVLDACAAPGGKTALMAEMMQGAGRVHAWDVHEHRVALLNAMKKRLQLDNIRTAAHDARLPKEDFYQRMDVVLTDAPCSGLGVVNDKPDIRYGVTQESVQAMNETQRDILNACAEYVKKGGRLIYSTCSILPEENEEMCRWFLAGHPEFSLEEVPDWVRELYPQARTQTGLQLLQGVDGDEGFYIACMKRNG